VGQDVNSKNTRYLLQTTLFNQ